MTQVVLAACFAFCAGIADGLQPSGGIRILRALLDAGQYEAAEAEANRLAANVEGLAHDERLAVRQLQVEALLRNGRGAEAHTQALAAALVTVSRSPSAASDAAAGVSLRLRGLALFDTAEYARATADLEEAVRAHERTLAPTSTELAADLEGLSLAYMRLERLPAAGTAIDRAIAILEAVAAGAPDARLAQALATRAVMRQRGGDYRRSGEDLERALAMRETLGPSHPDTARVLAIFGDQLWFAGQPARGREYLTRALTVAEASLRAGHPDIAVTLRYMAIVADDLGELDRAKSLRERGLRIALEAYPPHHPQITYQRHDLAISHIRRGEYADARRLLEQVLASHIARLGANHQDVAGTYHNLGIVSASIGDFGEAVRLQRRAVALWERTVGASHPMVPWALVALGSALASQRSHNEAVPILRRALAMRERSLGPDHIQVATTLTALSMSLSALGQRRSAEPLARRAVAILETSGAPEALSDALLVLARVEDGLGDHAGARRDYERVLAVRLPAFGSEHPSIGEARAGLALALAALHHPADAFSTAIDAERIGRDHLRLTAGYLSERQALGYAASRSQGLDLALSTMSDTTHHRAALDAVVRGRAIVLDEMAVRQRLRASATDAALAPLWTAFTRSGQRLANLVVGGPGDPPADTYAAVVNQARRERELAERTLADRSATLRRELAGKEIGLTEVLAALPHGSALVSFVRYDRTTFLDVPMNGRSRRTTAAYLAFVIRSGTRAPVVIDVGPASVIDALVSTWRRTALAGVDSAGVAVQGAERALREVGGPLRTHVWDPLAPHIAGVDRLFLVPDGALTLVPFAALPAGRRSYVEEVGPAIQYLSAERDLVALREPRRAVPHGLLAVGGPSYGTAATMDSSATRPASCGTFESLTFRPLPGSLREVRDVGELWRASFVAEGGESRRMLVLTADKASESAFKAASPEYRILHLATHGFFLGEDCDGTAGSFRGASAVFTRPRQGRGAPLAHVPSESPLLLSGLALSGANRRRAAKPMDDDGILTAAEVAALDLDGVEWAVLSACDTGLGEIRSGEGVFGLRRAFRIAGARTVIMSLWPVEDHAARAWMRALYSGRLQDKLSTSDAVRRASLTVLAERRTRGLSTHPIFWAGFVAVGDWH